MPLLRYTQYVFLFTCLNKCKCTRRFLRKANWTRWFWAIYSSDFNRRVQFDINCTRRFSALQRPLIWCMYVLIHILRHLLIYFEEKNVFSIFVCSYYLLFCSHFYTCPFKNFSILVHQWSQWKVVETTSCKKTRGR